MGYRNYIARISKEEYSRIKDFTKEQLYQHKEEPLTGYVSVYDVAEENLYELGKYVETYPNEFFKPVFNNKELQNQMAEEHDFFLVEKEFLAMIIESYSEKIRSYYAKMLEPFYDEKGSPLETEFIKSLKREYSSTLFDAFIFDPSKTTKEEQISIISSIHHIRSMAQEWGERSFIKSMRPYELEKDNKVTTSWKYEYAVFELVRIYKTFDWENNLMMYYGY